MDPNYETSVLMSCQVTVTGEVLQVMK